MQIPGYFLVPHEVSQNHVWLWAAYVGHRDGKGDIATPSESLQIQVHDDGLTCDPKRSIPGLEKTIGRWDRWDYGGRHIRYKWIRMELPSSAGSEYGFRLLYPTDKNTTYGNNASAKLLPADLPDSSQPPFRILLGSCFDVDTAADRKTGEDKFLNLAYDRLVPPPDIKIFTGDQVYLDRSGRTKTKSFFPRYVSTWRSLLRLFRAGGNFFAADDHEFWNNFPMPAFIDTKDNNPAKQNDWRRKANQLFDVFQGGQWHKDVTKTYVQQFQVGQLSFFKVEVRIARSKNRTTFMPGKDLEALRSWIDNLQGPGVVVLSQPFFASPGDHDRLFHIADDLGLPDFRQYNDLRRILEDSKHDIVVFTGDYHFGRLAWRHCGDVRIFEIMSSPMRLRKYAKTTAEPANVALAKTDGDPWSGDHFVTVDFHRLPAGNKHSVSMKVIAHPTTDPKRRKAPDLVANHKLIGSYKLQ